MLVLVDSHLEVDGVADDVHLGGLERVEDVSVVPIEVANGVVVLNKSLFHELLVVDIALVHSELRTQEVGGVDGVADPVDVSDVVFLAFVDLDVDVHVLGIVVPNTVFHDDGVAESVFVVFLDEFLLVFFPALRGIFLSLQESRQLASLVGFREGSFLQESAFNLR